MGMGRASSAICFSFGSSFLSISSNINASPAVKCKLFPSPLRIAIPLSVILIVNFSVIPFIGAPTRKDINTFPALLNMGASRMRLDQIECKRGPTYLLLACRHNLPHSIFFVAPKPKIHYPLSRLVSIIRETGNTPVK